MLAETAAADCGGVSTAVASEVRGAEASETAGRGSEASAEPERGAKAPEAAVRGTKAPPASARGAEAPEAAGRRDGPRRTTVRGGEGPARAAWGGAAPAGSHSLQRERRVGLLAARPHPSVYGPQDGLSDRTSHSCSNSDHGTASGAACRTSACEIRARPCSPDKSAVGNQPSARYDWYPAIYGLVRRPHRSRSRHHPRLQGQKSPAYHQHPWARARPHYVALSYGRGPYHALTRPRNSQSSRRNTPI